MKKGGSGGANQAEGRMCTGPGVERPLVYLRLGRSQLAKGVVSKGEKEKVGCAGLVGHCKELGFDYMEGRLLGAVKRHDLMYIFKRPFWRHMLLGLFLPFSSPLSPEKFLPV